MIRHIFDWHLIIAALAITPVAIFLWVGVKIAIRSTDRRPGGPME